MTRIQCVPLMLGNITEQTLSAIFFFKKESTELSHLLKHELELSCLVQFLNPLGPLQLPPDYRG